MISMRSLQKDMRGRRVTVMGLGHFGGGTAVARWLAEQGARVTATDAKAADDLPQEARDLADRGVTLKLGGHEASDFEKADLVVASPAVPPGNTFLQAALKANKPVTTEICLVAARLPTKLVFGVTGTKGKSTTATLLAKMLGAWEPLPGDKAEKVRATRSRYVDITDTAPRRVWLGGNLGGSLLPDLDQIGEKDLVVLELSSFMLHYLGQLQWSPHVAVVTMVGRDHLAWHGDEAAYHEAKQHIVRHQAEHDFAVLPTNSATARAFRDHTPAKIVEYGKRAHLPAAFAPDLPGKHNRINERGAYAAAAVVGVYPDQAAQACRDFTGLPHRLQLVHTDQQGVKWVDDSIATIPEAAAAACEAFAAGTVVQIIGGSDKRLDPAAMVETLKKRCRAVLLVGDTGPALADALGDVATVCQTLDAAVAKARTVAQPGDVVLLSPGYASYDQFPNFDARGEAFAKLAQA